MKSVFDVIIVDDNSICTSVLSLSLRSFEKVNVVGTAQNPVLGKKLVLERKPDLLFLDVEMQGMTGLQLLREIKDQVTWQMQVVFYTAYEKYLLEALRESAFDYLLKPFTKAELQLVMDRFFSFMNKEQKFATVIDTLSYFVPDNRAFMIATLTGYQALRLDDMVLFEYIKENKYWYVLLKNQTRLHLKRNTSAETILKYSKNFAQINQHQILNINYLAMIDGKRCILYPPFDNEEYLAISRGCLKAVQEKFSLI